jgi:hypothetical protein
MRSPDLVSLFVEPLNALGFTYMVTGAVAAIIYGEPRLTNDIDIVVALGRGADDAGRLHAAFDDREFYVPPVDVIAIEAARPAHGHFNLIHVPTALKADIYPVGDALHHWALPLRRSMRIGAVDVDVAPPEYVILRKLQYFRDGGSEKHLRDVRAILAYHGDTIDAEAVAAQVERLGLAEEWGRALRDTRS